MLETKEKEQSINHVLITTSQSIRFQLFLKKNKINHSLLAQISGISRRSIGLMINRERKMKVKNFRIMLFALREHCKRPDFLRINFEELLRGNNWLIYLS